VFGIIDNTDAPIARSVPKLALNLRETAAVLGLSPITIRRLNRRGLLRNIKAVRHLRFSLKEIERFIAETTKEIV
jgi:predicted site-specific integrase-resolvase